MWSALLAERGFAGPPEPLAGVQGFVNAMGEPPKWSAMAEGLGETWEIENNSLKPYPCGFVIHPFLDAVLDWRKAHPGDQVGRVVLRGNPLLSHRTDRADIATGRESQVSVQHAVAAALTYGEAGLAQFTDAAALDPQLAALRHRIEVVRDPAIPTIAAEIALWTVDGVEHRLSVAAARGSSSNPMSDRDLEQKLRTIAAQWEPDRDVQPLIGAVWNIETNEDVGQMLALTRPLDKPS
jgi:2-methylcitrate dehydratase PrpD